MGKRKLIATPTPEQAWDALYAEQPSADALAVMNAWFHLHDSDTIAGRVSAIKWIVRRAQTYAPPPPSVLDLAAMSDEDLAARVMGLRGGLRVC